MDLDVVGIGLAGGRGERARPLTVKAPGYLRAKAAMSFLGSRLVRLILRILKEQGLNQYYVVAHGKENRYQIKTLIDHGEPLGISVKYSRVRFDALNTGSADATIRNVRYWDLHGTALIFPTDSVVDFDLHDMVAAHRRSGSVITVGAMTREPMEVEGKYGVMLTDTEGHIIEFVEKPTLAEIHEAFPAPSEEAFRALPLLTNSGFYLVELDALREIGEHPDIVEMAESRLDFGLDLLPWMVGKGFKVLAHPIGRIGDLGNIPDYIETMVDALDGEFASVHRQLGEPWDAERKIWIHPSSLYMRDMIDGTTLEEKIRKGLVVLGPGVRIGQYSEVRAGTRLIYSNIDDGVEVHEGASVVRSAIRDGAIISRGARIEETYVGSMSEVRSSPENPTVLSDFVGLGDEVVLQPGTHISGQVTIWPRLRIPSAAAIPPGIEIKDADDVMRYL
ncbi:MAG: sugar phosphate nucleotidyltransferase [Actinomycetota bacterium]